MFDNNVFLCCNICTEINLNIQLLNCQVIYILNKSYLQMWNINKSISIKW